jgi:hypothetical protein
MAHLLILDKDTKQVLCDVTYIHSKTGLDIHAHVSVPRPTWLDKAKETTKICAVLWFFSRLFQKN